ATRPVVPGLTNSNNYSQSSNNVGKTVVAAGLQYQSLIAKFSPDRRYNNHAVGLRMDLNYCLSRELKISFPQEGYCDCLIVALDREQNTLTDCLIAANNLLTENTVKCELMKSIGKEGDVIKYGIKEGIPIIALFESNNSTVKERNKRRLKLK
ncbi:hypothetical protein, partial [Salmonella sp. s54836]|uniref:hypothetical protein n=1 Tax=Salmonella sp. s54836 TaxID=3159673 RepID=UPI0039811496